jgi:hypothetical protein
MITRNQTVEEAGYFVRFHSFQVDARLEKSQSMSDSMEGDTVSDLFFLDLAIKIPSGATHLQEKSGSVKVIFKQPRSQIAKRSTVDLSDRRKNAKSFDCFNSMPKLHVPSIMAKTRNPMQRFSGSAQLPNPDPSSNKLGGSRQAFRNCQRQRPTRCTLCTPAPAQPTHLWVDRAHTGKRLHEYAPARAPLRARLSTVRA